MHEPPRAGLASNSLAGRDVSLNRVAALWMRRGFVLSPVMHLHIVTTTPRAVPLVMLRSPGHMALLCIVIVDLAHMPPVR